MNDEQTLDEEIILFLRRLDEKLKRGAKLEKETFAMNRNNELILRIKRNENR